MSEKLERLAQLISEKFGERVLRLSQACGELTLLVAASDYHNIALALRDDPQFSFEIAIDLSGLDYSTYAGDIKMGRFAVSVHLLSISKNQRIRLKSFAVDDQYPLFPSLCGVWSGINWFEREAFDLFGIMFSDHPDLRRILTDYGFVGYPFRKDFPVSGHVEMRYDQELGRIVYQPVSIEPRENTPRIVRDENYGNVGHG